MEFYMKDDSVCFMMSRYERDGKWRWQAVDYRTATRIGYNGVADTEYEAMVASAESLGIDNYRIERV